MKEGAGAILTRTQAEKISKDSINKILGFDHKLEEDRKWRSSGVLKRSAYERSSELRILSEEMAERCIDETINKGEGAKELERRISWSIDLIRNLQVMGRSRTEHEAFEKRTISPDNIGNNLIGGIVWTRKDTRNSYAQGTNSEDFFETPADYINRYLKDYLENPWSSHPKIDWIFLDMLLTSETCLFFEEMKKWYIPGPKDDLGMNKFYYKYEGNLEKMNSDSEVIIRSIFSAIFHLVFLPVVIPHKIIQWLWLNKSNPNDSDHYLKLRLLMMDTLNTMKGPIVNPSRVKESMSKASDEGVFWNTGAWALIDHVIQRNPAVWIVDP